MKKSIATQQSIQLTTLLRRNVLALQPKDVGLGSANCPSVWGVMMESGFPQLVVSLVALADGSVSVYMSDGGSIIGCGLHPAARLAAEQLIAVAQPFALRGEPAADTSLPPQGFTYFYLLTSTGLRRMEIPTAELNEDTSELAGLYTAGRHLIDTIEACGAGHDLLDEILVTADHETKSGSRERACRIPPYAGTAVRRSQR